MSARARWLRAAWLVCALGSTTTVATPSSAQTKSKSAGSAASNKQKSKNSTAKQKGASSAASQGSNKASPSKSAKAKAASAKAKPGSAESKHLSAKPKAKKAAPVEVVEEDEDEADEEVANDERRTKADDEEASDRENDEGSEGAHEARKPKDATNAAPSLELSLLAGLLRRDFDYEGRQGPGLRGFELGGAPALGASLVLFPFASSSSTISMFGLEAGYSTILGVKSEFGGQSFDTSASAYRIQLVMNLPLGKGAALRPKLGYSGRTLVVAGDNLPDISEHGPRLGIEGRLAMSSFLAELEGGLQYLVSGGELTSAAWFPSASGFGADARVRGGFSVADPFQVLLEGALDYSSFKLNIAANDPHPHGVANGASDVAMSLSAVARLVLR